MTVKLKPNLTALRQLKRVVKAAPAERFRMRKFTEQTDCGTAYCAAGWAAIDPWFNKRGLYMRGDAPETPNNMWAQGALSEIFGLTLENTFALFAFDTPPPDIDPHAITKAEVIANIDRLLAGKRATVYRALRAKP